MNQSFTSSQVSERTGLTPRQLQWWDEQGIVVPARQGHRRLYSAKDLAELAILCDLRRRGFSLQRIRRMLQLLRREFGSRLADLATGGPGLHLLTDGESVFLCDSERGVIDLLRNTQQPLLAICLGPVLQQVFTPGPRPDDMPELPPSEVSPSAPAFCAAQVGTEAAPAPAAPRKRSQPARAARAIRATAQP